MASKIILTFSGTGVIDESIDITGTGVIETFKLTRSKSKEVSVSPVIAPDNQIQLWYDAFALDYNRALEYTVTIVGYTIEIEHFDNTHFDSFVDVTHNLTSNITTVISTDAQKVIIETTETYSASTLDKCTRVKVDLSFNVLINTIRIDQYVPGTGDVTIFNGDIDDASFSFEGYRNEWVIRIIMLIDGESFVTHYRYPPNALTLESVDVIVSTIGGTATINNNSFTGSDENEYAILELSVSEEAPNYQSSNVFTSLTSGDYIAYVRDKYFCVRSMEFSVSVDESPDATSFYIPDYFYISGKNSVRFANRVVPEGVLNANNFNFLTPEFPEKINYEGFAQVYSESQTFRIQFKSSYNDHRVRVYYCRAESGWQFSEIDVVQKTTNISRKVYLEGITTWNAEFYRIAISFNTGDIYSDATGNTVIGNHVFNNYLPAYYQIGTEIVINGIAGTIVEIIEDGGVTYAITSFDVNNPEASTVIESTHVALPYEVFHFDIKMSNIKDWFDGATYVNRRLFFVQIDYRQSPYENALIPDFPYSGTYISDFVEQITDDELTNGKYHIMAYGNENSDAEIDYTIYSETNGLFKSVTKERISHLKNLPYFNGMKRVSNSEMQVEKLDNLITKLDYNSMKVYKTYFKPLPSEYAGQVMDALNDSEFVIIDNMLCTAIEPADITHVGQLSTVSASLGVIGMSNELGVLSVSQASEPDIGIATGFYPVVT